LSTDSIDASPLASALIVANNLCITILRKYKLIRIAEKVLEPNNPTRNSNYPVDGKSKICERMTIPP
jgi:hypothetical protein